jgi:hypothetical protein
MKNDYLTNFICADKAPVRMPFIGKVLKDNYEHYPLHSFPGMEISVNLLLPGLFNNESAVTELMKILCATKLDHWQLGDNPQGRIYCCGMKSEEGNNVEVWAALHRIPEGGLR